MIELTDTLLNEYLDDELDTATRQAVEQQLAASPEAQARLAELQALFLRFEVMPDVPLTVDLSDRIVAELKSQSVPLPKWLSWLLLVELAAAAVLFIILLPTFQEALTSLLILLNEAQTTFSPEIVIRDWLDQLTNTWRSLVQVDPLNLPLAGLPVLQWLIVLGLALFAGLAGNGLLVRQHLSNKTLPKDKTYV